MSRNFANFSLILQNPTPKMPMAFLATGNYTHLLNARVNNPEEDITSLLFSIFDNLNNLYEKLNRLIFLIERRNIEQLLYREHEGEKNEN
jgi:hypothetical protein